MPHNILVNLRILLLLRGDNVGEVEYQKKISTNLETKQRIAAYCAGLVTEGMQVFLDAGTTVFYIARELLAVPNRFR